MPIPVDDTSPSELVSLGDLKEKLNIPEATTTYDGRLRRWLDAATPLVEQVTGPIIVRTFDEWHDGGQGFIRLRRRPSTGYGTTPILRLLSIEEYRGPTKYPLSIVPDPAQGSLYTVMLNPGVGTVARRSSGGGNLAFPPGIDTVHVIYEAGQATVPPNVFEGVLELLRVNWQTSQPVGPGRITQLDTEDDLGPPLGYWMPRRVVELLSPQRRHPSIA